MTRQESIYSRHDTSAAKSFSSTHFPLIVLVFYHDCVCVCVTVCVSMTCSLLMEGRPYLKTEGVLLTKGFQSQGPTCACRCSSTLPPLYSVFNLEFIRTGGHRGGRSIVHKGLQWGGGGGQTAPQPGVALLPGRVGARGSPGGPPPTQTTTGTT